MVDKIHDQLEKSFDDHCPLSGGVWYNIIMNWWHEQDCLVRSILLNWASKSKYTVFYIS